MVVDTINTLLISWTSHSNTVINIDTAGGAFKPVSAATSKVILLSSLHVNNVTFSFILTGLIETRIVGLLAVITHEPDDDNEDNDNDDDIITFLTSEYIGKSMN